MEIIQKIVNQAAPLIVKTRAAFFSPLSGI